MSQPIFYSRPEICRLIGISRATLYRWIQKGFFPKATKLEGRALWNRARIHTWVEEKDQQEAMI